MVEKLTTDSVKRVGFILLPGFALTSFSLAVEALSVANLLSGQQAYDYRLFSGLRDIDSKQVLSSNGVPVQTEGHYSACGECDILFICAYQQVARHDDPQLFSMLRRHGKQGGRFASLSSGSFILARAGLLKGLSCTLVGEQQATFAELYPTIPLQENLYTVTGNVLSCAGGMSALDMLLYIIGQDHGREFAYQVSHQFLQDRVRTQEEIMHSQRYLQLRMKSATLGAAIEVMEANLEHPYSIEQLAMKIGTSCRALEMAFKRHEDTTPSRYYLQLRLASAKRMLEETNLPISTIAQAAGFTSQSYFTKRFKEIYQLPPREVRQAELL